MDTLVLQLLHHICNKQFPPSYIHLRLWLQACSNCTVILFIKTIRRLAAASFIRRTDTFLVVHRMLDHTETVTEIWTLFHVSRCDSINFFPTQLPLRLFFSFRFYYIFVKIRFQITVFEDVNSIKLQFCCSTFSLSTFLKLHWN